MRHMKHWPTLGVLLLFGLLASHASAQTVYKNLAGDAPSSKAVIILDSTVIGTTSLEAKESSVEAQQAIVLGYDVVINNPATWGNMTQVNFASYRAIILGDASCFTIDAIAAAEENRTTWSPAITGNMIIIGTDPAFHRFSNGNGGTELTHDGIAFAAADPTKTGAYITLSCYYLHQATPIPVPLLDQFGTGFMVEKAPADFNDAHIVATHPAFAGLTDSKLSNWHESVHEIFSEWPVTFQVFAIAPNVGSAYTATDGTVGTPYILTRGAAVISNIKLSPENATNPVGATHTVTATISPAPPPGTLVTFKIISGPNASLGTLNPPVPTDAGGVAVKAYVGTGGEGTDFIVATYPFNSSFQTSNTVTKTWHCSTVPLPLFNTGVDDNGSVPVNVVGHSGNFSTIPTFDLATGTTISQFVTGASDDRGRGVEVVAGLACWNTTVVYYTSISGDIHVAPYAGGSGGPDITVLSNPRQDGNGIQDLDYANGVLYAMTGYNQGNGAAPIVYSLNPCTGAVLSSVNLVSSSRNSDGFTVLPSGDFLINDGDAETTYRAYGSTTGAPTGLVITLAANTATGVDYNPSDNNLYFNHNSAGRSLTRTDLSGNPIGTIPLDWTGKAIEDISVLPSNGATDAHYALILPNGNSASAQVLEPIPSSYVPNNATSRWIGPKVSDLIGTYTYSVRFTVPDCDPHSVIISGQWASDNEGVIRVNGVNTTFTTPNDGFKSFSQFNLNSTNATFHPGLNTLDFVVENTGGITGLRVEMSGTVVCCACVAPPSGLVDWWPFDETSGTTSQDIRGFVNNLGTQMNGPTPSVGKVDGALCLDGVNDYVEVENNFEINFPSDCPSGDDGPFTIDAWVKTNASSGVHTILDKRVNSNQPVGYSLFLADGRLGFQLADGSVPGGGCGTSPSSFPCTNYVAPASPSPQFINVASGDWHLVAVTVTRCPVAEGKLYVDGNLVLTFTPRTGNINNSSALQIGRSDPAFDETYFDGCIDELEFFKRALSEDEIHAIFEARSRGKCFRQPCPAITINPTMLIHQTWGANVAYPALNLTATGGTGPYTFTVTNGNLPPGMVVDADGKLHGRPVTPGNYGFAITVEDANGCLGRRRYQIVIVDCPPITLNPAADALAAVVVDTPYSQTFTASGGCASPFTFTVTSGALPPGVALDANGVLSGTPTQSGDFFFIVTATDSCGCSQSQTYTLKVHGRLMISRFRQNGPAGPEDEFVEIFNPSNSNHTVASNAGSGYEVFATAGNGTTSNAISLVCEIPNGIVIQARGYFLCTGSSYSLGDLGRNGGPPGATAVGDAPILADIPNDAGLALINLADFFLFDRVGFAAYGLGSPFNIGAGYPANIYPFVAPFFCEGTCLQPAGDASTVTSLPGLACPLAVGPACVPDAFPVVAEDTIPTGGAGTPVCYGESGQYEFLRRQTKFNPIVGTLHQDTGDNAADFILVSPNPAHTNVGQSITGVPGITSVLGAAGPHNLSAPPDIPGIELARDPFDDCGSQLDPRNAERNYSDPTILDSCNAPRGTLTLRVRFTNVSANPITGLRFRVDDLSTLCGAQTPLMITATGNARNLSLTPDCQGSDSFTAILKVVNSYQESVVDCHNFAQVVNGSVIEDLSSKAGSPILPGPGELSPFGGGVDTSLITNPSFLETSVGTGVTGGTGMFATTVGVGDVLFIQFKFGVVKSGRFKVLITPEGK